VYADDETPDERAADADEDYAAQAATSRNSGDGRIARRRRILMVLVLHDAMDGRTPGAFAGLLSEPPEEMSCEVVMEQSQDDQNEESK
jgi:hypothetical protein